MTISLVRTRYGAEHDVAAVTAMHERCSATTRYLRFHAPTPRVRPSLARRLLRPPGGWSLLAELGGDVVAMACAGPLSPQDVEVGLLVEDAHQGRGLGARLLRETCADAALRGYLRVHLVCQAGNRAVLRLAHRVGLPFTVTAASGLVEVRIELGQPGGRPVRAFTQHSPGSGARHDSTPAHPSPSTTPATNASFIPHTSRVCSRASASNGQLASTSSPSRRRGS